MYLKEIKNIYHLELDPIFPKEEVDSFFYKAIEHYLGLERFVLALEPDLVISKEKETPLFRALNELRQEKPIQYVLGLAHFCGMDFKVDEQVLIPRPETEELVYWILDEVRNPHLARPNVGEGLQILDVGTGSGCIAISMAKNLPHARVTGIDISEGALKIAKENAGKNKVDVTFVEADALSLGPLGGPYDIIVSNPPYVREKEKETMHNNVLKYEPETALFVADEDPLLFYRSIVGFATVHLKRGGMLFFEINQYLGKDTLQLLEGNGFSGIELKKDMYGNDRMLKGILSKKI
ncbi:MAG TPA: peptide chain release factor N(5)-glutamine methyltransferase [Arenibacter sp.]|nr:peptide chain release factor N(5)-glutamine methyltransferase [Arenibacter sp.]